MSLISAIDPVDVLGGYTVPTQTSDPFGQTIQSGLRDLLGAGFAWGSSKINPINTVHPILASPSTPATTRTTASGVTPRWIWAIVAVAGLALVMGVLHR